MGKRLTRGSTSVLDTQVQSSISSDIHGTPTSPEDFQFTVAVVNILGLLP